jgi:hypothetical protein
MENASVYLVVGTERYIAQALLPQNRTDDAPYGSAQILNYGQQRVPAGLTQLSTDELKCRAATPYFSYGIEENSFLVCWRCHCLKHFHFIFMYANLIFWSFLFYLISCSNVMHPLFIIFFHIPLHVSSNIVLIIRRNYCIHTASGSL